MLTKEKNVNNKKIIIKYDETIFLYILEFHFIYGMKIVKRIGKDKYEEIIKSNLIPINNALMYKNKFEVIKSS